MKKGYSLAYVAAVLAASTLVSGSAWATPPAGGLPSGRFPHTNSQKPSSRVTERLTTSPRNKRRCPEPGCGSPPPAWTCPPGAVCDQPHSTTTWGHSADIPRKVYPAD
jgi:hypothetical protein